MHDNKNDIRYAIESNSYIEADDWQGSGQPKLTRIKATIWRVIVNDPARFEACEIHEFQSLEQAKQYIADHQ